MRSRQGVFWEGFAYGPTCQYRSAQDSLNGFLTTLASFMNTSEVMLQTTYILCSVGLDEVAAAAPQPTPLVDDGADTDVEEEEDEMSWLG